ncbi:N-acetylmuramic acid 6-phosphate etherase [Rhizobiaceae bacterium CRRU44]|uniref:N-acetylmuramic acid 6-phosphate etherase n=1 Tax=Ferranicluibacter rubi TaxID=2715133 RepID=A0AA43ZBQ6_9HYPH|nr:N-acetylmuramic acid 6-phosphate etherase [Ferranicluibacter rubi]NHT74860.1 N-acetylmuramic acid 6-phosphate etherase [Ferranicluibacter rubi]
MTEERHAEAQDIDVRDAVSVLKLLAESQQAAARAVDGALEPLAAAAGLATQALQSGGRLIYAGAGSSGLMAMVDALELPGTYGLAPHAVVFLLAGGAASLADLAGGYEDDHDLGVRDVEQAGVGAGDCLVIVSASGSTPYALGCAAAARATGASVVAIANNAGARLFEAADVAVLLETPPEVISGSTRMGAGTAQKIALNMLSTMVGIGLGHVHDGHMVNLRPDNRKLRQRAAGMVADIAGIDRATAERHLEAADGSVKIAVLLASGVRRDVAQQRLDAAGQSLRRALALGDGRG